MAEDIYKKEPSQLLFSTNQISHTLSLSLSLCLCLCLSPIALCLCLSLSISLIHFCLLFSVGTKVCL